MSIRSLRVVGASIAFAASVAMAHGFVLQGVVRDFKARGTDGGHPDMTWYVSGLVTGLVSPTLDADRKPEFVGTPGTGAITDASTFRQWYRDVPGVNLRTTVDLPMTFNSGTGQWTYENSSFFPIDNQLFGNQGQSHNYNFTLEVAGSFFFDRGRTNTVTFTGDDDIWVYVNGQLIVDLGGVHGAISQSVDLNALAPTLGLVSGNAYDLNIFWAERHPANSNVRIDTSFEVVPEPLSGTVLGLGLWALAARRRKAV